MSLTRDEQITVAESVAVFTRFRDSLAPLDRAMELLVDGLLEFQATGDISDKIIVAAMPALRAVEETDFGAFARQIERVAPLLESALRRNMK